MVAGFMFATTLVAQAVTLESNDQGATDTYGNTQGIAIDFDSTDASGSKATPALTNGVTYSVDSLQVRVDTSKFTNTKDVYLAVYTGIAADGEALTNFVGASDNAVTLTKGSGVTNAVWTFSNISVTSETNPGSGGDQLYFIFQTNNVAQATTDTSYDIPVMRQKATYVNVLSAVVRGKESHGGVQLQRNPNYIATLTVGGGGPGPGLTTPVITSIDFSGGTVSVTATNLSIGSSCVLIRSDDLTGTFTPVDGSEITPTNQVGVLQDTNPPPANAFYKVESTK